MNPVNSNILIGKKDAAFFAANPTLVLLDGQLLYNENTGELFIGDGVTQLNALSPINSGFTPSGTNTQYIAGDGSYINFPTDVSYFNNDAGYLDSGDIGVSVQPYDSNTTLLGNSTTGSGSIVLATSPTFGTSITTPLINPSTFLNIGNAAVAGGSLSKMRVGIGTSFIDFGESQAGNAAIWMGVASPGQFTYSIRQSSSTLLLNAQAGGTVDLTVNTNQILRASNNNLIFTPQASAFAAIGAPFTFTCPANTNQTSGTNIPNFQVSGNTKSWAAGTITNQYWSYFTANTAAFASASTITNSYGLYVQAATAGTNATITNNYAAGFSGQVEIAGNLRMASSGYGIFLNSTGGAIWFSGATAMRIVGSYVELGTSFNGIALPDTRNITFSTATGTKIGTATNQKIGFWNATPIIQPTTAVASATFVANSGTAVNDASTFDGYTVGQVVKALRNTGLLA